MLRAFHCSCFLDRLTTCVSQVTFRKNSHYFWPFSPSWAFQNHFVSVLCCHYKSYHRLNGLEETHLSPYSFCKSNVWSGPYRCWQPCSFLKALKGKSFSCPFQSLENPHSLAWDTLSCLQSLKWLVEFFSHYVAPTISSAFLYHYLCDYREPTQVIQDNLPV